MPVVLETWHQIFEGILPATDALAAGHEGLVHADAVGPGAEAAGALEARQFPMQDEEGVLEGVLAFRLVPQDPLDHPEEHPEVGPDQGLEGLGFALAGLADQVGVGAFAGGKGQGGSSG
jgi:hypothetical protein